MGSAAYDLVPVATLEGHSDRVWHVAWHPRRDMLATCSSDRTIRIWALKRTHTHTHTHAHTHVHTHAPAHTAADAGHLSSTVVHLSPAGTGGVGSGSLWACIQVLDDFSTRTARSCEWSPDGRFLACASFDGMVTVWAMHPESGALEAVSTLEGHENEVKSVAWSPSGDMLATCGRDKAVWLWQLDEEEVEFDCAAVLHGHAQDVKFVLWHPTRDLLFSASYDDTIKIWGETDDDWVCVDTLTGHESTVWSLAFDPSGMQLISCSEDCTIMVWQGRPALPQENPRNVTDLLHFTRSARLAGYHTRTIFSVDVLCSSVLEALVPADMSNGGARKKRREAGDHKLAPSADFGGDAMYEDDGPAASASQPPLLVISGGADDSLRMFSEAAASDSSASHDPASRSLGLSSWGQTFVLEHAHDADVNCVRWHRRHPGLLATAGDDHVAKLWQLRPGA